jgi:hypothetical protein
MSSNLNDESEVTIPIKPSKVIQLINLGAITVDEIFANKKFYRKFFNEHKKLCSKLERNVLYELCKPMSDSNSNYAYFTSFDFGYM